MSFTGIKVSIFILCGACNTACLWRREQRIVGTGQHLFRENECWHHPSRTPASCLSAALLWKPPTHPASSLIFFGNTWWQKGVSSPHGNHCVRIFDSALYPQVPHSPLSLLWHQSPASLSSSSKTYKWLLLFQTQLMIYLQHLLCPCRLKISNSFTSKCLKVGLLWNLHVLGFWLVNKYSRVPGVNVARGQNKEQIYCN